MHQNQPAQASATGSITSDVSFEPTGILWRDLATLRSLAIDQNWSHAKLLAESDKIIAQHETHSRR